MKKVVSLLLCVVLTAVAMSVLTLPAAASDYTDSQGVEYYVYSDHVSVDGYHGNGTSVTIAGYINGKPVTSINYGAFEYAVNLESISIPNTIKTIDFASFFGCVSLKSVTIPGSVKNVDGFGDCDNLQNVVIQSGAQVIEKDAFNGCTKLRQVTIPTTVKMIEWDAFYGCSSLQDVYYTGTREQWNDISISYGYKDTALQYATKHYNCVKPGTPKMTGISNTATGVQVTWNGVSAAESYRIYRKTSATSWKAIANVGVNTRSCLDKTAQAGVTYQYTVRSINAYALGGYNTSGLSIRRLAPTKITSIANGPVNIVLKWNKAAGATGYYVYRKGVNTSWVRVATTKNPTYSDSGRSQGVQYFYTVRAYYGNNASTCAPTVNICRLQQTTITSLKKTAAGQFTVYWGKKNYATGYQVYYKTGNTAKTATCKNPNGSGLVIGDLKSGATYTVYVRTYRTVGGKNSYSCWSPAKTVKV